MYIDYIENISYVENLEIALKFWKMGNREITTEEIDGISYVAMNTSYVHDN